MYSSFSFKRKYFTLSNLEESNFYFKEIKAYFSLGNLFLFFFILTKIKFYEFEFFSKHIISLILCTIAQSKKKLRKNLRNFFLHKLINILILP